MEADPLEEFERLAKERPKTSAGYLFFGRCVRFVLIASGLYVLVQYAPAIDDRPIGSLTVREIALTVAIVGIGILGVKWLFNGTTDETAESWAGWGIVLICAIIGLSIYLSRA